MEATFDIVAKELSLTNPSLGTIKGNYKLTAPNGQVFYENAGYASDDYSAPDFTDGADVFTNELPLDITGNVMQTTAATDYLFELKTEGGGSSSLLTKYNKLTSSITFGTIVQNCTAGTATIPATTDLPEGATTDSAVWTIIKPDGSSITFNPVLPSLDCVISPIVAGTYMLTLVVTYTYSTIIGPSEVFVTDRIVRTINYTNTCGNGATLLCQAACLLNNAIFNNNKEAILQLTGLVTAISASIECDNQTVAQSLYDTVIARLKADGIYENCNCGCS